MIAVGTKVKVSNISEADATANGIQLIYLYHRGDLPEPHVCQTELKYVAKQYDQITDWKFVVVPTVPVLFMKKASAVVLWLEQNGFIPTETGIWRKEGEGEFFRDIFFWCDKPVAPGMTWPAAFTEYR